MTKSPKTTDRAEVGNIHIILTSAFNAAALKTLSQDQLRDFIEKDVTERLDSWLSLHFPTADEHYTGSIVVQSVYVILDSHYNHQGRYRCNLIANVASNVVLNLQNIKINREDS